MARNPLDNVTNASFSRRALVGSSALVGATAALSSLTGCGKDDEELQPSTGEPQVIEDASLYLSVPDEFEGKDNPYKPSYVWELPVGSVPVYSEGAYAVVFRAGEAVGAAVSLSLMSLSSGNMVSMLKQATSGSNFELHDARCSDTLLVWIEIDYVTRNWKLLAQPIYNAQTDGDAVVIDEGDKDFDPPLMAVYGDTVIWNHMPNPYGERSSETSYCYLYKRGSAADKHSVVWESVGRFATAPTVSDGYLTITPRVRQEEGTYYGLTAIDLSSDNYAQVDQLVLPSGIRPFSAAYWNARFAFSVEASYGYGGLFGSMGSYIGREGETYLVMPYEPAAPICGWKNKYIVKVRSSHYVVDVDDESYCVIACPDRSLNWGDYPASVSEGSRFVTYAACRDLSTGQPANVQVRVFDL